MSRRVPPSPVIDRLRDQAIRITVGRYVSTVHSEHLVPERILQLQRRSQRRVWGKGSSHKLSRWTDAMVREMRRLHLIEHRTLADIAAMFDTHDASISRIVRWLDWSHTDHDMRDLPRPNLRPIKQGLPAADREQRREAYRLRYNARRRQRRAEQSRSCASCAHHVPKAEHCGLGIPEARSIHYANHCAAYAEAA